MPAGGGDCCHFWANVMKRGHMHIRRVGFDLPDVAGVHRGEESLAAFYRFDIIYDIVINDRKI